MTARPLVSVVVPMHDEQANVATTLACLAEVLEARDWDFELVPVDDGSTDSTAAELSKAASSDSRVRPVSYRVNRGRGYALRRGFAATTGEIVACLDADLSYSPDHIVRMTEVLLEEPEVDLVVGSAYMPGGRTSGVSTYRLAVSRLGNAVLQRLFRERIYTSTGILRAYRGDLIRSLELRSDDKEIHLEIISKAFSLGWRITEIPATLQARRKGRSHFRLSATMSSHLLFAVLERPAMLFGAAGLLLLLMSGIVAVFLLVKYFEGGLNPERPLMTVMVLLFLAGQAGLGFAMFSALLVSMRNDMILLEHEMSALRLAGSPAGSGPIACEPQCEAESESDGERQASGTAS